MRTLCLFVVMLVCLTACSGQQTRDQTACKTSFIKAVENSEIRSVNGLAIAPEYQSYFFTSWIDEHAQIMKRDCIDGAYANAYPLYPGNLYQDYQPVLSRDGKTLYFTSTRPMAGSDPIRQNVWKANINDHWQTPEIIEALVSPFWDGHGVELDEGVLLFASARGGDDGMVDIFQATKTQKDFVITAVDALNGDGSDNDMAYHYARKIRVFSRYDANTKDIDLFTSQLSKTGWTEPEALENLNTSQWEMSPAFTPDGNYFLFKRGDGAFQILPSQDVFQ